MHLQGVVTMDIAFAAPTRPEQGTWVVLAARDGALGPTGAELDRRSGGALQRAIADWGSNFKRGEAIELRYPPGLELDRVLVLSLGKPEEASRYDLETRGRQSRGQAEGSTRPRGQDRGRAGRRARGERAGAGDQPGDRCMPARLSLRQVPSEQGSGGGSGRGRPAQPASGRTGRGRSRVAPRPQP